MTEIPVAAAATASPAGPAPAAPAAPKADPSAGIKAWVRTEMHLEAAGVGVNERKILNP